MTPATSEGGARGGFAPAFRVRECVRAVLLTPEPSILLLRLVVPDRKLWITPGGGIAPGETHLDALRRELKEELGRDDLEIGPRIWIRHGRYRWAGQWTNEREHFYLVSSPRFEPDLASNPEVHERQYLAEFRWWPLAELPRESKEFAPMRIGPLARGLVEGGIPKEPVETGF